MSIRLVRRGAAAAALAITSSLIVGVGAARAATIGCGQVIKTSVTLTADIGPCAHDGLIVRADHITVNLGGHRIFGTPEPGDGAGVFVKARVGVTVENGTVSDFDGGVVVVNGYGNTVTGITATDNVGSSGDPNVRNTFLGDGILLEGSSHDLVEDNTSIDNGPFSGIGMYSEPDSDHHFPASASAGNLIFDNTVTGNVDCRFGPFCDNDGIRIEPGDGPGNVIRGNTVDGNGLDGISLFADSDANVLQSNVVDNNGFHGAVPGDGIRVFSSRNVIVGNTADANAAGGVSVGGRTVFPPGSLPPNPITGNPRGMDNILSANRALGNGVFDLYDSNPGCDHNLWSGNTFGTAEPSCTTQ